MKNPLITLVILLISISTIAQEKAFKGVIFNRYTKARIAGVLVTPTFYDSTVISNEKGRVSIVLPQSYKDTLVFSHPDYYPFVKRVSGVSNLKINFIELIPKSTIVDTTLHVAYKENRWLKGVIIDKYRSEPLKDAVVSLENDQIVTYSNISGIFAVGVPRSAENIIVSHDDFKTQTVPIKYKRDIYPKVTVNMERITFTQTDTLWKSYKNMIEYAPFELIIGSLGVKYQRFVTIKHGIGFQTSTYIAGTGRGLYMPNSQFSGIKIAPFFRYYESRNMRKSSFLEVKLISGYFDISDLYYSWKSDSRYGEFSSEQFWSFGVGVGLGWSYISPHSKHAVFTISAGVQFFPIHVPDTIESDNYGTLNVSKLWWYIGGPGNALELKVTFGGIF